MCNQRERLIGFIYNEGDAAELREVHEHVEGCAECRAEIAALRNVRDDLLAWDVPPSESVWRPFQAAPVAKPVWWRQMPAWAMAAAASVMLVGGFAGGAVAHGLTQETVVASGQTTQADLDARDAKLRDELLRAVRTDLDARIVRASNASLQTDDHAKLQAEIAQLRELNAKLVELVNGFDAQWQRVWHTVNMNGDTLGGKVRNLEQVVQAIASK